MRRVPPLISHLLADTKATATVEYALLLGLIVLAILTALSNFAGQSKANWTMISTQVENAVSQSTAS